MSKPKRVLLILVALILSVLYLALPFAAMYWIVIRIFGGPAWLSWMAGFLALLVMINAGPGFSLNMMSAFRMTRLAATLGSILSKTSSSPAGRLAAASVGADALRRLGDDDRAEQIADRGLAEWEKVRLLPQRRGAQSVSQFALCKDVKGHVFLQKGHFQEALNSFYEPLTTALPDKNQRRILNLNCVAAMNALGYFKEALEYVDHARALGPMTGIASTLADCHAAVAFVETGQGDKAREVVANARAAAEGAASKTQVAITSAWVNVELGDAAAARKDLEEAKPGLDKITEMRSIVRYLKVRALTIEGRILETEGRVDEAVSTYKQAVDLGPVAAAAMDGLARVYERVGRQDEARAWRERLLRDVPQSYYARRLSTAYAGAWPPTPAARPDGIMTGQ